MARLDDLSNHYGSIWAACFSFNPTVQTPDPHETVSTNKVMPRVSFWLNPDLFSF
jgi:hypothetical protein